LVGDIIKIYPGARLPADGVIVAGSSNIDESLITGISIYKLQLPDSEFKLILFRGVYVGCA
jgi:P-type E1-E2 ATPase